MFPKIKNALSKRKFQHFLYTHILFLAGIVYFNVTLTEFLYSLLYFIVIIASFLALIAHLKFNHNYIDFKILFILKIDFFYMYIIRYYKIVLINLF